MIARLFRVVVVVVVRELALSDVVKGVDVGKRADVIVITIPVSAADACESERLVKASQAVALPQSSKTKPLDRIHI